MVLGRNSATASAAALRTLADLTSGDLGFDEVAPTP
jgi:hypothetical protein